MRSFVFLRSQLVATAPILETSFSLEIAMPTRDGGHAPTQTEQFTATVEPVDSHFTKDVITTAHTHTAASHRHILDTQSESNAHVQ